MARDRPRTESAGVMRNFRGGIESPLNSFNYRPVYLLGELDASPCPFFFHSLGIERPVHTLGQGSHAPFTKVLRHYRDP